MTVGEVATVLGVSAGRVRQLITAGRLPAERVHPQLMLLRRADVEAFATQPRRGGWPKGKPRKTPDAPTPEHAGI